MNFYPFHMGDYASHTGHLDPMEDLAYRRMLDAYYLREKPLPGSVDAVAKIIRMRDHTDVVRAVLDEFFEPSEEGYRHVRCDQEIAHMQDKQAKAKAAAQRSLEVRAQRPLQRPLNGRSATNTNTNTNTKEEDKSSSSADKSAPKAKASKFCPESFRLTDDLKAWASENVPGLDWVSETEKFRDWEFKQPRSDWAKVWRLWMRKAHESRSGGGQSGNQGSFV